MDTVTEPERIRMRIGNAWRDAEKFQDIRDPYRGDVIAHAPVSSPRDCDDALEAARRAKETMAAMPGHERAALLHRIANIVAERSEAIARVMTIETGKALRDSLVEVQRAGELLHMCAEEAIRIQGEHIPMEGSAIGAGKIAMTRRARAMPWPSLDRAASRCRTCTFTRMCTMPSSKPLAARWTRSASAIRWTWLPTSAR